MHNGDATAANVGDEKINFGIVQDPNVDGENSDGDEDDTVALLLGDVSTSSSGGTKQTQRPEQTVDPLQLLVVPSATLKGDDDGDGEGGVSDCDEVVTPNGPIGLDEALTIVSGGSGRMQTRLVFITGLAFMADAMEVMLLSFLSDQSVTVQALVSFPLSEFYYFYVCLSDPICVLRCTVWNASR
jgi:hypothetical protein